MRKLVRNEEKFKNLFAIKKFQSFLSFLDMIAATSVLQQQASDIRTNKINWQSYQQSQMISQEDFNCITALDGEKKAQYLKDNSYQCAKTFLNLLSHVSKDTTIQYLLVMIDDILTVSFETGSCD